MKIHVVIRESGKWSLVSKPDANTYKQAGYEVITFFVLSKTFLNFAIPIGILLTILSNVNKISNIDLRLGFTILILMKLLNWVKW